MHGDPHKWSIHGRLRWVGGVGWGGGGRITRYCRHLGKRHWLWYHVRIWHRIPNRVLIVCIYTPEKEITWQVRTVTRLKVHNKDLESSSNTMNSHIRLTKYTSYNMENVLLHMKEGRTTNRKRIQNHVYAYAQFRITLTGSIGYQASTDTSMVHLHGFEGKENIFFNLWVRW